MIFYAKKFYYMTLLNVVYLNKDIVHIFKKISMFLAKKVICHNIGIMGRIYLMHCFFLASAEKFFLSFLNYVRVSMKFYKNKLGVAVSCAVLSMSLSACGGSSGGGNDDVVTDDWATDTGRVDSGNVFVYDPVEALDTCVVDQNTLIVLGDFYDEYASWMWDSTGKNLVDGLNWPGEEFTANDMGSACSKTIHYYNHANDDGSLVSLENYNVIVNNNGKDKQTGDGNVFTQNKPCLKMTSETDAQFVTAAECGVHVKDLEDIELEDESYISYDGGILKDGATIEFTEIAGKKDTTGHIEVGLLIKGKDVDANTKGSYWFSDAKTTKDVPNSEATAAEFTNGAIISIGDNVEVADGETKNIKLNVKFNNAVSVYTIKKSYVVKDTDCRLHKQNDTLGAIYTPTQTTFRIWSPDSKDGNQVIVDGTSYDLKPASIDCYSDVFEAVVEGDLAGKTYQFIIGGKKVRDPYGKMTANGNDTANIVMDMSATEPEGGWAESPELKNRVDSIVYEVHVRDFTIDETSGVDADKRGRYLGMVQTGTKYNGVATGIDHLKELGITHVQLQPIYDYKTCSDVDSQSNKCYNWGYDPWNYNVPEDRYTSVFNTDEYNKKVQEVKTMINEFHKNGIRVIMDVVYNHTYNKSVFEDITGKYYLKTDVTGCGNTVNSNSNMVWTMIRDSMDYWVNEYHVDGFRLDLVGAFSIQDFSDWGVYLNRVHPDANLLIYGEPWAADNDAAEKQVDAPVRTGRIHLQSDEAHVGAFNNRIRNCLKGSSDDGQALGFIFDKLNDGWDDNGTDENDKKLSNNKECVFMGVRGGVRHKDATGTDVWTAQGFTNPEQSISYVTAHDNLALRDKIEAAGVTDMTEKVKLQGYSNAIIAVSQGITFIHGGEEIGRTKAAAGKDMHNTYNTTTGANDFKWDLKATEEWGELFDAYAGFIKMRKNHPAFHMTTADDIFNNVTLDENSTNSVVIFDINGAAVGDSWSNIKVVLNSTKSAVEVSGVEGMTKVVDNNHIDDGEVAQNTQADAQSVSIWVTK